MQHKNAYTLPELLAQLPGIEPDVLGKLLFALQTSIKSMPSNPEVEYLTKDLVNLIPLFKHPSSLIDPLSGEKEKEKEKEKENENRVDDKTVPVLKIIIILESFAQGFALAGLEQNSFGIKEIIKNIQALIDYYTNFLATFNDPSISKAEREQLLIPKARLADEDGNFYLIPQSVALALFAIDGHGKTYEEKLAVNHAVAAYGGMHFKSSHYGIHDEYTQVTPINIAKEIMVATLYQLVSGDKMIAAPSMLAKLSDVNLELADGSKTLARPMQVSYTIKGLSLDALITLWQAVNHLSKQHPDWLNENWQHLIKGDVEKLEEYLFQGINIYPETIKKAFKYLPELCTENASQEEQIEEIKNILTKIDTETLSALYIASFLTNASDGKTNNYMVAIEKDPEKGLILKIISIDNDEALKPAIFFRPHDKKHELEIKCCLYCLPNMSQSIDANVRKRILGQSPALFLLKWLVENNQREHNFKQMQAGGTITQDDIYRKNTGEILDIPLRVRPGTITEIYRKLTQLYQILLTSPKTKHKEILRTLDPVVFHYLKAFMDQEGNIHPEAWNRMNNKSVEDRLEKKLDVEFVTQGEEILSFEFLREVVSKHQEKFEFDTPLVCTQTLSEMVIELVNNMSEDEKSDPDVIKLMTNHFSFIPSINLPSEKIDELFIENETITKMNPIEQKAHIKELLMGKDDKRFLNLQGFDQLSPVEFNKLIEIYKNDLLSLNISQCPNLTGEMITKALQKCKKLEILNISHHPEIKSIENKILGVNTRPLILKKLRVLKADHCPHLATVNLKAPLLSYLSLNHNEQLKKLKIDKTTNCCDLSVIGCDNLKNKEIIKFMMRHFHRISDEYFSIAKLLSNPSFFSALRSLLEGAPKKIDLSGQHLNDAQLELLVYAVESSTSIKILILDDNDFTSASAKLLFSKLTHHPTLKKLSMDNNSIGDSCVAAISDLVCKNNVLKTLNINKTNISLTGIEKIANALQYNKHLTTLTYTSPFPLFKETERKIKAKLKENQTELPLGPSSPALFSATPVRPTHKNTQHENKFTPK